jgi:glycosyltransferase involved in cell wall biosynthesis
VARDDRRPIKVLLIAEAANPDWTSVPLVGWNIYQALAKIAHVHLVTHTRNQCAIEARGLVEGRDFTAIDNERAAAPLYRLASILRRDPGKGWTIVTALSSIAYYAFEQLLWEKFEKRLKADEYDIVHRVTPLSPTSQSLIAKKLKRLGIPFVVGPLNGGVPWPKNFMDRQHSENEWLSHLRATYKLMPGYWSMRRHSAAILVGSKFTLSDLPRSVQKKAVYVPENGISAEEALRVSDRSPSKILRCAFVGRLVPYKGADLLLEAAREYLEAGKMHLDIAGDGPDRAIIESFITRAKLGDAVSLHGAIPHRNVLALLRQCDVMIFPSIREFGGGVVIEAMAVGAAVIVADYAGPAELVDAETGIKIAFHDRESLVTGLRLAIGRLLDNPEQIGAYKEAARSKVLEMYTWEAKANQIFSVYEKVLQDNAITP